ncbi:MAG: hypothetical protein EKK55_17265 [Rhodocyclaceae bacterium]|nr:MAG: hypothetical protein EKK55_17265 [Rhodocyclaceae bacterium]
MKTIILVASLFLIGCAGRENGWETITTGASGPVEPPEKLITKTEHPGYVELFFKYMTPPSDSFSYSDERFHGRTLTVYAQVGAAMVTVTPDRYQVSGAGTIVTFKGLRTLWPECSSIQIAY